MGGKYSKPASRTDHLKSYAQRRAAGVCCQGKCRTKTNPGKAYCDACAVKRNAITRAAKRNARAKAPRPRPPRMARPTTHARDYAAEFGRAAAAVRELASVLAGAVDYRAATAADVARMMMLRVAVEKAAGEARQLTPWGTT